MKTNSLVCVLSLLLWAAPRGAAQGPASTDTAEKAAAEIRTVAAAPMTIANDPETGKSVSREQRETLFSASAELVVALGEKFIRDFPQDSRRWEVIQSMLASRLSMSGPAAEERRTKWAQRRGELMASVLSDPTAPGEIVGNIASMALFSALQESKPADIERARGALKILRERAPETPLRAVLERLYLETLHRTDVPAAVAEARRLAEGPHAGVADMARTWLAFIEFKTKPLDLKFPDLDGHEVDLAKYRGKVVLLDFWATWCVPCMEQMPHMREMYDKYHAQGFEVIGITDDIPVRDPAKQRPVEKTVATLKEFLVKHNMPWPQLWDTRPLKAPGPKGLLAQFGVQSLPTYLLFDKNGMFVTSDLGGEKLEAELRRLLQQ